jgi:hypothetical protein
MNSPMASFTAHSVFGTKPALVSVPTVGTIFSTEAETPSVSGCSSTISLLLHEASIPAAITAAEIIILVFIFLVDLVLL